ncbi:MAG: NAD-dependent epimerase/dehydratase family protein [Saprospiraceae bacterium]|nr:NAD-dependent epimerase/dehydratase family protein [Saprospiraceae bacterium]
MHITVTGATGLIGNNLVRQLLLKNYKVRVLYKTVSKDFIFDNMSVEKCAGDILDSNFVEKSIEGTDIVIHLAAIISIDGDPTGMVLKTNTIGVENVVKACFKHKVKKLIHFSSIHAFKLNNIVTHIDESHESADESCMAYDQSKAKGEQIIIKAIRNGLDAYILHPTGVLGPHDYFNSLSGILLNNLYKGNLPALIKGGFDWVDVRDVCNAVIQLIRIEQYHNTDTLKRRFILSGHWSTIEEIAKICSEISGIRKPFLLVSKSMAKMGLPLIKIWSTFTGSSPLYTMESINTLLDNPVLFDHSQATNKLNYHPRSLRDTLADTYDWFKNKM